MYRKASESRFCMVTRLLMIGAGIIKMVYEFEN